MEDLYDPEEKIFCPYNSSHHIRRCKMSFHLVKCKKNYPDQKMVSCDFNTTHMVPEPELRYHHQICSDRKKLETQIVEATTCSSENKFPIVQVDHDVGDNWDNENVPTYDPKKYTETHEVLRQLDVESGAKRKNFRLSERQRMSALSQQTNRQPPKAVEPVTERINLPAHRAVTNLETVSNPQSVQQRLKLNPNKVYLQYKKGS